ncbi:MAG: flavodoxin, partial [Candidatus Firestonebacteria bacterium]
YSGRDDIEPVYINKIFPADILVIAGAIKDRYLSSRWKKFTDRGFFKTHQPIWKGKQVAYIISGPANDCCSFRQIIHGFSQVQEANLVDVVCDDNQDIDGLLHNLAEKSIKYSEANYIKPMTFLGVGGIKVFRDEIYSDLRFVFQGDHKYYSKNGMYDFPNRKIKVRLFNMIMMTLTKIPGMKDRIKKNMKYHMIKPLVNLPQEKKR